MLHSIAIWCILFYVASNKGSSLSLRRGQKMKKRAYVLCMMVAVMAFLGWTVENVFMALTCGCIDNRSMYLPFLLGYGIGVVAIYLLLGTPKELRVFGRPIVVDSKIKRIIIYMIEGIILVSVGEIVIGTVVEEVCGFEWWNYSSYPLHVTKYTSLPTSFLFATLITVFMNFCFVPIYNFFEKWNGKVLRVVSIVLMVLMVADFLYAAYQMYETGWLLIRWRIIFNEEMFYGSFQ